MLYFAYGSNLNTIKLKRICPSSVPIVKVKLKDYKLVFYNKVADIVKSRERIVYGAIYDISEEDIKKLDKYEGYPRLYDKIYVNVQDDEDKPYLAFVYVMFIKGRGELDESYYNIINQGFNDWKLPIQSLINARKQI